MQNVYASGKSAEEIMELAENTLYLQRRFLVILTDQFTDGIKLSVPQYTLLGFLSVHESLNMGALAQMMGHTTPATTGLVDRLADSGHVERFTIPSDRRQVLVRITAKGKASVDERKAKIAHNLRNIMQRLNADDQEAWLRINRIVKEYCIEREEQGR